MISKLIDCGKSEYKIIIPSNSSECIRFAAQELNDFVKKSSNTNLCISDEAECVGNNKFISLYKTELCKTTFDIGNYKLHNDGYLIKSSGDNIFIDSNSERGVLYGVYEFLERFFGIKFLTEKETYIPKLYSVNIETPIEIIDNPSFDLRTYINGDVFQTTADMDFMARTRSLDALTKIDKKHGGGAPISNRNCVHNFHCYVPYKVYLNEHPEF